MHHAEQIDINDAPPMRRTGIAHFTSHANGCIVEHVIEPAMFRGDRVDRAFDVFCGRNVELKRVSNATRLGNSRSHLAGARLVDVGHNDAGTATRQFFTKGAPDSGSAPSDNRDSALEKFGSHSPTL